MLGRELGSTVGFTALDRKESTTASTDETVMTTAASHHRDDMQLTFFAFWTFH